MGWPYVSYGKCMTRAESGSGAHLPGSCVGAPKFRTTGIASLD
jgi:hypothetical protein